ncbi:unnamed protein product [Rotaria sp. Silwood2]|nr:unnamed protein product [Rotaria sp. Silwood2]
MIVKFKTNTGETKARKVPVNCGSPDKTAVYRTKPPVYCDSDDEGNRKKDNVNEEEKEKQQQTIIDETQTNLAMLREEMYSIVQTNITPEQCAYK